MNGSLRRHGREPDADTDPGFVQELDAARFQGAADGGKCAFTRPDGLVLDHVQGDGGNAGPVREGGLGPFQQAARRADLSGIDHRATG